MIQISDLKNELNNLSDTPKNVLRKIKLKNMIKEMESELADISLNKKKEDKMDKNQEVVNLKKQIQELKDELGVDEDTSEGLMVEKNGNRCAIFRDYSQMSEGNKLKRLLR